MLEIASAVVALVVPYLVKGADAMVDEFGRDSASGIIKLFSRIRDKFKSPEQHSALDDLNAHPEDPDVQGQMRLQLRKALETDPSFSTEVADMVKAIRGSQIKVAQSSVISGNDNDVVQISGDSNTVRGRGCT